MKATILLTGATGFLGAQIARRLLAQDEIELYVLVRARDAHAARQRLLREWWDWPDLRAAADERVRVLVGDITRPMFGLDADSYAGLVRQVTHIIHSAADIRLFAPLESLRAVNVTGTRHALDLAHAVQTDHGLTRFAFVSTAYVAGKRSGPVAEEDLTDRFGFSSPYEQSKYEAERLVREAADVSDSASGAALPISIFRPGMIVGDSLTGAIRTFNTLYYPLRLYLTGRLSVVPARPDLRINLVPVDYVADAVARLTFDPRAAGLTFHLSPSVQDLPSLGELAEFTRRWAAEAMDLNLPRPRYLPALGGAADRFKDLAGADLAGLVRLLPYFEHQPDFLRDNADRLLGPYPHRWQAILPPLLAYAVHYSFWHRTNRTVYEQVLFRLSSTRKPITYHDLVDGREITRSAGEMRAEILAAAGALRALGIKPGERVAVIGLNSTRYFSILIACGLLGVVSTPLYATCPPAEIDELLKDSQARLLLVGAPAVLNRLDEIHFDGPLVSFCRVEPTQAVLSGHKILNWAEFLAMGVDQTQADLAPVALDDFAALYYTSGTTGRAKGVIYRNDQLRWLGETLASMYPWHERNRWGAYLSYLPMNHVVEGILATYSPYYVPAALDIYYLEDFAALQPALQVARPTIFFSVPRFFEKVRAAVMENPLARRYQQMPEGAPRRLVRTLLRRGLLRKAGLTRCRQIIVGSAPSTPELLGFFHDLGVEVHDAFGLTEAPLISLNRLGHNRLATSGQPLPETEIRVGPDGEIQVRGPQVAAGYFVESQVEPFADGWLSTGDLGTLSEDGYLSLSGRKKDLIITSYGGNIAPAPIEADLRAIPGVAEAMLVGDGQPYCAALLWMEESIWSADAGRRIDVALARINAHLAHPEQVKRWVVLPGSLTVENGSLTGSMKIKRAVVTARLATVIEALYSRHRPVESSSSTGVPRPAQIDHSPEKGRSARPTVSKEQAASAELNSSTEPKIPDVLHSQWTRKP